MNTTHSPEPGNSAPPPAAPKNGHGNISVVKHSKHANARNKKKARENKQPQKRRSFPHSSFEDALAIGQVIQTVGAGNRMRRLTIFDNLGKSPDSGPSRMLVTNSARYGITSGGYQADYVELTPKGRTATDPDAIPKERLKAKFDLAIEGIEPFKFLCGRLAGNKLPGQNVIHDMLREAGYAENELAECVDTFIVNVKYLGLLRTIAGAERLLTIEHVLEEMPSLQQPELPTGQFGIVVKSHHPAATTTDWSKTCFYITPIGADDSEHRKHSDLFLNCIVEPALAATGLQIIRADQIGKPGMITAQIVEHVLRSRLVIADLSFHNPNVFYELCLRHTSGLPTVQIIRGSDPIPFDLQQYRTIQIDTTDIYSLVPKMETYKSEIATQVRRALENAESADNPITTFCPGMKLTIPERAVAALAMPPSVK
jgi:hypothetical protein